MTPLNWLKEELKTLFFLTILAITALAFVVKDIIKRIKDHNNNPPGPPAFT